MCNAHKSQIRIRRLGIIKTMDYGKFFKEARKQSNLTQQEVAKRLKVCQSNVSDWENDVSRPEYEKLIELAKIYQVSIYDLLGIPADERF